MPGLRLDLHLAGERAAVPRQHQTGAGGSVRCRRRQRLRVMPTALDCTPGMRQIIAVTGLDWRSWYPARGFMVYEGLRRPLTATANWSLPDREPRRRARSSRRG